MRALVQHAEALVVGEDLGPLGLRRSQIVTFPAARSTALTKFAGEVGGHEHSRVGIAAAAPCSAATPTNSIALSRLRLEGRVHSDAVGVNSPFTVHSGPTVNFFSAFQAHRVPHPLEPYCSRERDAVAPTMTREKGWHHPTVSWLSKPVLVYYQKSHVTTVTPFLALPLRLRKI